MEAVPLYDPFSSDYDRFVNWEERLAVELPFIERQLAASGARRVLDTACGTGMHAIALAQRGYEVVGVDLSVGMIERARQNAVAVSSEARFVVAGFGELATKRALSRVEGVGNGFDAVLCLGNSLPHVLTTEALHATLIDFAAVLRHGGLLLVQNRNFDAVLASRERWMEPQAHREGGREWLFLRFYDFDPDGMLTFNLVTLRRQRVERDWSQEVATTRLWPQQQQELMAALVAAGFEEVTCWGSMQGVPFDSQASPNLVVTAQRRA